MKNTWEMLLELNERHIKILEKCVKDCDYKNFSWWKKVYSFPAKDIYDEYFPYWKQRLLEVKDHYKKLKETYEAAE